MRIFTADLLERYRSADPGVAQAAEAEWEEALARYEQHAQALEAGLPPQLREFAGLLLHDAVLQSMGREGGRLIMVLRKDIPPRDLVILSYQLEDEPVLVPFVGQPREWRLPARFDFDELERREAGPRPLYGQSIVFDNGWELRLGFRDVQVTQAAPWSPVNGLLPQTSPAVSQTP